MENWEALTIALGALAANMREAVKELDKTVGPAEVDYISVSSTVASVKMKHGFDELAEALGAPIIDYEWARFIETPYGEFYEEKPRRKQDETV